MPFLVQKSPLLGWLEFSRRGGIRASFLTVSLLGCAGETPENTSQPIAADADAPAASSGQSPASTDGPDSLDASPPAHTPETPNNLCPHYDDSCSMAPASGGSPSVDPPALEDDFVLLWEDQFDTFDETRWRRHDHTFEENASYFSYDNVRPVDGKLELHLTQNPTFDPNNEFDKPYLGAEVSTAELFQYVRITGRIRFAHGQGIVSSLFTFADNANDFWNEIDVEYLGYQEQEVQYNLITSNCRGCGSDRSAVPYPDMIGVPPYEDFYDYQITWIPGEVSFSVNGIPRWTVAAPDMTEPARIRMNVWPTSGVDPFAGTLNPADIPTFAEYDWIRVEQYVGD